MARSSFPVIPVAVLLVVTATVLCTSVSKISLPSNQCASKPFRCRSCGRNNKINVKIIAKNVLVTPNFKHDVTIYNQSQCSLLHFLEQAAEQNGYFNFSATYYPTLGYFIDSINGVRGFKENKTFWHIIGEGRLGSLQCGASSFIPVNKDTILFNFTTWAQAGFDY